MKFWSNLTYFLLATALIGVSAVHGATYDETGAYNSTSGGVKNQNLLGELFTDSDETPQQGRSTSYVTRNRPDAPRTPSDQNEAPSFTGKLKLSLRLEPGDGVITATWNLVNAEEHLPALNYRIFYGTEPGKVLKTIEVGATNTFRIRELKNYQPYYVSLQAYSKDRSVRFSSSEEKASPLPDEERTSHLEAAFSRETKTLNDKFEPGAFDRNLKQIGYAFFKNSQALANATDNLPVGADYRIGPGDTLNIDLWGALQGRYELTVDRNGELSIPKVGTVNVWGLTYENAKAAIHKTISRYFKGFELNVTLGKLRTIQVYVVGEVASPGMYSVSSLASVLNALTAAGGPTRNGSLRTINLMRGGKSVKEVDLYDIITHGDRMNDVRLENGDTVYVPVIGPVFAVAGEVKRPAIFEMKGKISLADALVLAGGITAAGDTGRIQVERIERNTVKVIIDITPKERDMATLTKIELQDRDMIKVFAVNGATRKVVSIQGNVFRPGDYEFHDGMRVHDIIPGFEVLIPDTYLESAAIIRLIPPDRHREIVSFNLKKALEGDPAENIPLMEQDTIKIYSRWDMKEKEKVGINGQVVNPGTYDYYPNMTVRELVVAAGSLKRNAFLENAELTRVIKKDGKAKSVRMSVNLEKALAGDSEHNLSLLPDDVLIVRGVEEWLEAHDRFVTLEGEVKFPGTYSISKGELLSSAIARAGGYTEKAYLLGAKFTRRSVRESQQKRMNEMMVRTEKDILQKQSELASLASSKEEMEATKAALEGLSKSLETLKNLKAEGRVVIRLTPLSELDKSVYDLSLEGGDDLYIPTRSSVVNVMGEVFNPTALVYMPGKTVSYYLGKTGGATHNAEEDEMYIVKVDGTVFSKQQSSFGIRWNDETRSWTTGSFTASQLDAGDTVVVPLKLDRVAWLRTIKDITTIISQIALTAGTIMVGLR